MNFLNDRSTSTKLFIAFGVIAAFTCATGWVGSSVAEQLVANTEQMYRSEIDAVVSLERVRNTLASASRDIRRAVLARDEVEEEKWLAASRKLVAAYSAQFKEYLDEHRASQSQLEAFRTLDRNAPALIAAHTGAIEAVAGENDAGAAKLLAEAGELATSIDHALAELARLNDAAANATFEASASAATAAREKVLGLIVFAVLVAVLAAVVVSQLIAGGLRRSVQVLQKVARGDFTARLDLTSKDEMGQLAHALNQAVTSVRDALDEVREVAADVAAASSQLSASSQDISSGAQEQASSLEETAASLEEITGTIKQNSDNAQQAAQLAAAARGVADHGRQVVTSAVAAMGEISQSSERIVDIISTIDDIAFQTNLLALNAAVEAARTGEQGRGFAVVATEVRNLAYRSATSAREIKSLIQESVKRIDGGTRLVNQSGASLEEIVGGVKRVTDIVGEIAAASREQSTGIEQVNKAVTQMDGVTQSNAGQTEELSATASNLSARATQLQELVSRFVLDAEGTRPRRAVQPNEKKHAVLGPRAAESADGAFESTHLS